MIFTISNGILAAEIDTLGAEVKKLSAVQSGINYLWCGDKKHWCRVSPVLFPIIGVPKEKQIVCEDKSYPMTKHGFARDVEFGIISRDESSATLAFASNSYTRNLFPYEFCFSITYSLIGHTLHISHKIDNNDTKSFHFALGGHPAFSTEINGTSMNEYYLEFDRKCDFVTELFDEQAGNLTGKSKSLGKGTIIELSPDLFDFDALIFSGIKAKSVKLKSRRTGSFIMVDYSDFENLGVWSSKNCSRFVCIEPWLGITDSTSSSLNMKDKKGGFVNLAKDKTFKASYSITVVE